MRTEHYRAGDGVASRVDRVAIMLYLIIAVIGCVSVFSSSYEVGAESIFDFSHNYVKQVVWLGISLMVGCIILFIDTNIVHKYTYILYIASLLMLALTLLLGREVNGAKAWFELGFIRLQPVELVKITTSLALARVMSDNNFSITSTSGLLTVGVVLALPLMIIVLQNDTGSGIVFGAMLFVLYREGLSKWLVFPPIIIAALFVLSLLFSPFILLLGVVVCSLLFDCAMSGDGRMHLLMLCSILLATLILSLGAYLLLGEGLTLYQSLLTVSIAVALYTLVHAIQNNIKERIATISIALFSMLFMPLSNFIFNQVLRLHQQNRIMSFLGIVNDPLGSDYNVNQAKIAIGSGGMLGKGFLEGTQIRYGFVPERHTDFIFCSIAEEWGFIGSLIILACFGILILRLMRIGEEQNSSFSRIYCYAVASILLFHLFVNIGMTIGLFPVMGIPLPLVSYGGSSLLAFTIMIAIAIQMSGNERKL